MKMIMVLIAMTIAMFSVSCTKDGVKDVGNQIVCEAQKTVTLVSATAIASTEVLNCKNITAIQTYLNTKADSLKLCKKEEATTQSLVSTKSVLGDTVCSVLVQSLESSTLGKIPAEWECSGGELTTDAKAKVLAACQKAL